MNVTDILKDIKNDLEFVRWSKMDAEFPGTAGAQAYVGTGPRWTHRIVTWSGGSGERCDGVAVLVTDGFVVRYTPELAVEAMKSAKAGGQ
jgi:hypothetical protein